MVADHVAGWIIYALLVFGTNIIVKPEVTIQNVLFYIVPFIITFYLSLFCLNLYKEKGIWWSVISFFIVFIVMVSIGYLYIYSILPSMDMVLYTSGEFRVFFAEAILAFLRIFSFALIYFYIRRLFEKERMLRKINEQKAEQEIENARLREQKLEVEKEKLQYEQMVLRAQINPHFLYNTLNTLFAQALTYDAGLADNILKLSNLMRYSIESLDFDNGKVLLQRELEHLQQFVDIHSLRFRDSPGVHFELNGTVNGQWVPPLSLITLVENAFKYGDLADSLNPLTIKITLENDQFHFYCRNKIKKHKSRFPSNNIGVKNLQKRLKALFPEKHSLNIIEEDNFYTLSLTIKN